MKYDFNAEPDQTMVREMLKRCLQEGIVGVTFEKTDGTERFMNCTLDPGLMPEEVAMALEAGSSKPKRKPNLDILPVFDVDLEAWRSFRVASVKSVEY